MVFESATDPQAIAERVVELLGPVCGYADAVLVRPVPWVLERLLGVPVTSRGVPTMVRLAAKLA